MYKDTYELMGRLYIYYSLSMINVNPMKQKVFAYYVKMKSNSVFTTNTKYFGKAVKDYIMDGKNDQELDIQISNRLVFTSRWSIIQKSLFSETYVEV